MRATWPYLLLLLGLLSCKHQHAPEFLPRLQSDWQLLETDRYGKGALLLSRFDSLEQFCRVVRVEHFEYRNKPWLRLTHYSGVDSTVATITSGVSELDLYNARAGNFGDKLKAGLISPYAVVHRNNLERAELMARRRYSVFGEGAQAFYDLAVGMVSNIIDEDKMELSERDLDEKGFINTFNHITAQAFVTSIFNERLADFIADMHERYKIPEMITGYFSEEQIADIENGAVDNYLDIINNEWGQELGKDLKEKYLIDEHTCWTPALLANYLNDIQAYHGWAFSIAFEPFRASDRLVIRFVEKLNFLFDNCTESQRLNIHKF